MVSRFLILLVALLVSIAGCNRGPKVYHVSGNLTYQGQPIPRGKIYFDPQGHGSEQGIAEIIDGRYDTRQSVDLGIKGGKYIIRVQGFDGKGGDELPWGQPLFNEYQTERELKEEDQVLDLDVPADR